MNLTKPQIMIYNMVRAAEAVIANNCSSMLISGQKGEDELQFALNELFRINDALRFRLDYNGGEVLQQLTDFCHRKFEVLHFNSEKELTEYADEYSKQLFASPEILSDFKIVILPDKFGIIAKLHHIISDAWTFGLLYTQFNAIINNATEPVAYSYVDYLETEKAYTDSKRYLKDREFFHNQIKKTERITLFNEKESISLDAKRKVFILDSEKAERLKNFASENDCSIFSVFSLIFAIYISRIKNNENRFFIGTTILNRYNERELNTAGVFINTVPMLFDIDSDKSFSDNLEITEDALLSVFRHQKYNYNDLLSDLRKDNKNHYGKLFDVMINYMNAAIGFSDESIHSTWHHNGKQNETLQINIDDRDNEGVFKIHYDYQTDKFTDKDIEQLHWHICNILEDAVNNPHKKISQLNMLTAEERHKLLHTFNDTAVEYDKSTCPYALFEEHAIKNPHKAAVIFKDTRLSYKELYELVGDYAAKLNRLGVRENDVVAVHLERSHRLVALQLAVLKIGAIFLPLDKRFPAERLKLASDDCNVRLLITDEKIESGLSAEVLDVSDFEAIKTTEAAQTVINMDSCYIIYTSGSTGKPKGCLLTGRGLLNFCKNNNTLEALNKIEDCVFACVNSVSFDYFIAESLLPLTNGFTTVVLDDKESTVQREFLSVVVKNNINVLMTTPTRLKIYFGDNPNTDALSRFRCICTSGEPLTAELLSQMYEKSPRAKVYNPIGPSECSVWDIGGELNREDGLDIHIGKPIANAQIYITDKYLNPVPIGVTGEICIGGDGVGAGYINNPELTAEKFVDNPFGEGRLYKTGDLAHWREDGNIVFVGRNDFQVKIRGLRIELGEIESAVCSVEGTELSVAVVRTDENGVQYICVFYTGKEKAGAQIKAEIQKKLPSYMLPHIFVHLEEMPLTSSGKINRRALPEVCPENINVDVAYVPPEGKKEAVLVECIEDIFGIEKVSMLNNFFDIGGDSLRAIELTAELEKYGYEISVKSIFNCTSIREIACAITETESESVEVEYNRELPATAAQLRVYTSQLLKPDAVHYNVPFAFKVKMLDTARLETAVNVLIQRHESLRTRFENRNGNIIQVIENTASVRVEKISDKDDLFNTRFDLSEAPLLKVGYCENTVMVVMHHIISDGESMNVFFRELNELYMGRALSDAVQYGEFAVTDSYTDENKDYWLDVFSDDIPSTELVTDFPKPEKSSFAGTQRYEFIDGKIHREIAEKCKEKGITPFVYYMACFSVLLSKFSGKEDIIISTPISGRSSRFLNTIGMFVNTVPIRSKPEGNKEISVFLNEIKDVSVGAIENQRYPLNEIMKNLGISASGKNPLVDIMFVYQNQQITDIVFGDEQAEILPVTFSGSKCDLVFNIVPLGDKAALIVEYSTELFRESTIKKFICVYKNILACALDEARRIKDIHILSSEERHKLLHTFNDTAVEYDKSTCPYALFEEHAIKNPHKAAVIFKDTRLSYKELYELVGDYAAKLNRLGVRENDVVAVHLERSHRLVALQLAVLKIGAIFLPLDKRFPAERLKLASDDCNVRLLITDEKIESGLSAEVLDVSDFEAIKTTEAAQTVINMDSCYIIYTSGSTGKPKGCLLTGRGLLNFCKNNNTLEALNKIEDCVFACVNSVSFDYFIAESLLPLTNGFTTVVLDDKESTVQREFLSVVVKNNINVLMTTPTRLKIYFGDNPNTDALSRFRCICTSGEPLTAELLSQMYEKSPRAKVYNPIGPSECSVWDIGGELNREDGLDIHIGKPIANAQIYITDKYLNPVPIGVTGEICIGGDGVGAGYINNPELTAEKFVDNPFGEGRLYKTGDLAHWREDGNIVFVGRNDFQVKIRGLRIELGEIESAVCSVEGTELSVAVVRTDENGVQYICVFYTGKEKAGAQIKAEIQKKLPSYMLPHIFVHLEEMPLTSSGKINRRALPEVSFVKEADIEEPANETEKLVCDAFKRILGLGRVGRNSDFFESGGTSLSMITLLSEDGFEGITAAEFMRNPTPKELSLLLEKSDKKSSDYLEALYVSENPERVLVVFPFGGGGAEGFSAFVSSIKSGYSNVSVYFVRYLHTVAECEKVADEIKRAFGETEVSFYSHCAGAAVAMNILKKLEKDNYSVKHYYAGAIIPEATKSGSSIWDKFPDFVIEKAFVKAGAGFDGISDKAKKEIVSRFRKDTDFAYKVFFEADSRFVTPVTVIISKKDIFTFNYKQAEKQWKKYAENLYDIKFIEAKSHYFQSDNADELTDILFG